MAKKKSKKPAAKKGGASKKSAKKAAKPAKKPAKKVTKKPAKKASPAAAPRTNTINPYLTFAGNCEDAFNFYRSVFGGKFGYVGRYSEMPPMEGQPPLSDSDKNKIMHISLAISKETVLMGADGAGGFGHATVIGNNFSISVNAKSKNEADRIYNGLASGGQQTMPIANTFWGSYFGMLTDKFGINWMVSYDEKGSM